MTTATVISEIRQEAGLTQLEMGEKIGVTDRAISNYELGVRVPKPAHARKIVSMAKKLGLKKGRRCYTLDDIYGG